MHIREAHFVFREVVGERASADAFVARDAKIVERDRAVREMQIRGRAVHPHAAEARPLQRDGSIPRSTSPAAGWTADREVNGRRSRPFPLTEKLMKVRRDQRAQRRRIDRAIDIESKIVRRIQEVGRKLARAMPQAHIAQHGAVAIPGKIGRQIAERNAFVVEVPSATRPMTSSRRRSAKLAGAGNI